MIKIKSKSKICRRLGTVIFPKCRKYLTRKPYPPGQQPKRRKAGKQSEYGRQLFEKQKLRFSYGLSERQLKNYFKKILSQKIGTEDKANQLFRILEKRLDNVIYRAGFAVSRLQARQMVSHKFFLVNQRPVNIPSYQVKIGDIISVKESKLKKKIFQDIETKLKDINLPSWLKLDKKNLIVEVVGEPSLQETPPPAQITSVFEFYSR